MKTYIKIDKLKIFARIGVAEHERIVGNQFEVSIDINVPLQAAGQNDDINMTVNYATVCEIVRNEMSVTCKLIENVAWRIYNALISRFPEIESGKVTITKVTPPISEQLAGASVVFEW